MSLAHGMRYPLGMTGFDDARRRLAGAASPLGPVTRPLTDAAGLRLATATVSRVDQPPADVSAMDGYAARAADIAEGHPLPVACEIQAGVDPGPLAPSTVARIFTGAPLPPGADVVVPQERAETDAEGHVTLEPRQAGEFVRARGEVFRRQDPILPAGSTLTPGGIGLAAAGGCAEVQVFPRPRVALMSTGSELVGLGETPPPGQIHDSNTPMLEALAAGARLEVASTDHARDDLDTLTRALGAASERADVVVTAGGVSVGDYDLVPRALAALGGETIVHGIAMKPGKPTLIARLGRSFVIGLPGNPVAAFVGWRVFVRPLVEALAGDTRAFKESPLPVTPVRPVRNPGPRLLLLPCYLRCGEGVLPEADPIAWKGSHDVRAAAAANGLLRVEPESADPGVGSVGAYPLPWRLLDGNAIEGTSNG